MKTRITKLLGIQHPIIQSGMGFVAGPSLVAATSNAGGMGILAAGADTRENLRKNIAEVKSLIKNHPFAVNVVPIVPSFRDHLNVMIEESVPIWSSGIRNPFKVANIRRPNNILFIPTVGSVGQAISVEKSGADAVIVQSWESGGHSSPLASMILIPQVVEAVKIPVIAAGGFCDGKGLAAALALGAEGIAMGTRFAATQESSISPQLKDEFVKAKSLDAILSTVYDGLPMRCIRGEKRKRYLGWWTHMWDLLPCFLNAKKAYQASWKDMIEMSKMAMQMQANLPQFLIGMEIHRKVLFSGDNTRGWLAAGQVTGRIKEISTCEEVINKTVAEAEEIIRGMNNVLRN